MVLDYTPSKITARSALTINPAKTCQPLGAVYAALGIHRCMPHSHGSQGCLSYLRMALSRHYREPAIATTSSFHEGTAVFGGLANLKEALVNVTTIYKPDIVAIHTTCVAETIGDDVGTFIEEIKNDGIIDPAIRIFYANTPSYVGTHITGYDNMVKAMVNHFPKKGKPNGKINVIPGFIEPGDIREIKHILRLMGIPAIVFPDQTNVLDSPLTGKDADYPKGGTTIPDLIDSANSLATFALCRYSGGSAARLMEQKFKMPSKIGPIPIGIENTDEFVMNLKAVTGKEIPEDFEDERGRLVDILTDAHPHFHGKKVAIFGDPDTILGITGMCRSMGMEPTYVLTGTKSEEWEKETRQIAPDAEVISGGDLFLLHQKIKNNPVDLLIGNSHGKYIARAEDIPQIRVGFPISDRANLHYFPIVGYRGAAMLATRIGNKLLDRKDRDTMDEKLELIM
ncbi:MAG: nitrogenase molybdenum-iron protein subunit beta [Candidatus Methanoperedens sp.]|nr:nitrogenase molybdenum-iron protein subunit beta [Candidatus Methanoperedens sp.]